MIQLTDKELLRYDRQISLKEFDIDKQTILKNASVLIIGVGGLGCSASLYLCKAGIGKLTLVDFDIVSESNLSRQILYTATSLNNKKVTEAKKALLSSNPDTIINTVDKNLDDDQLIEQIKQHDIVLDCTDNLVTRKQINRCCFQLKKPLVMGAAIRMEGILSVFRYQHDEPCYQCFSQLFGHEQLTCVEAGIMSPVVGMVGTMQALEAIKLLTSYGSPLINRLLIIDAMTMQFNEIQFNKLANCSICSHDQ